VVSRPRVKKEDGVKTASRCACRQRLYHVPVGVLQYILRGEAKDRETESKKDVNPTSIAPRMRHPGTVRTYCDICSKCRNPVRTVVLVLRTVVQDSTVVRIIV
jgi:hypothetical protein